MDSYLHHQARADPNAADVSGEPPLIEAACYGDLEASTWEEDFHAVLLDDSGNAIAWILFCLFCCFLRIHFYGIHHHFSCHHSGESYELFSPSTKEANPRLGTTVSAWSHATETSTFSWYLCQSLPFLWIVKSHVGIGNIRMLIWVLCFFMWSCFLGIEYCVHVHEYTALYNIVFVLLECMQLC